MGGINWGPSLESDDVTSACNVLNVVLRAILVIIIIADGLNEVVGRMQNDGLKKLGTEKSTE